MFLLADARVGLENYQLNHRAILSHGRLVAHILLPKVKESSRFDGDRYRLAT